MPTAVGERGVVQPVVSSPAGTPTPEDPSGPVRLTDVARHAGVSVSTASNALTGNRAVSAPLIERVLASAAELGYRRNELAHSLRTGRRHAIGLVIPDVTNPFFAEIVSVVEECAHEAGLSLTLCNTGFDPEREAAYLARLVTSADGVLLFSTAPSERTVRPLVEMGLPLVMCDEPLVVPGAGTVHSDNAAGGRLAAHHLVDAGATSFGLISGPATLPSAGERRRGFEQGLAERGHRLDPDACVAVSYSLDGGREGIRRLLARDRPLDGVLASTDMQAIGALFEAADRGRKVPDDLLICGFDGIGWSDRTRPTLSTVQQDIAGMARTGFEMLASMVAGDGQPGVRTLPVSLVVRESTSRG